MTATVAHAINELLPINTPTLSPTPPPSSQSYVLEGSEYSYDLRIIDLFEMLGIIFPLWKNTALADEASVVKMASHWTLALQRIPTCVLMEACHEIEKLPRLPHNMLDAVRSHCKRIEDRDRAKKRQEAMDAKLANPTSRFELTRAEIITAYLQNQLPKYLVNTEFFKKGLEKDAELVEEIKTKLGLTANRGPSGHDIVYSNITR